MICEKCITYAICRSKIMETMKKTYCSPFAAYYNTIKAKCDEPNKAIKNFFNKKSDPNTYIIALFNLQDFHYDIFKV